MNLQENIQRIKQMMGLLTEEEKPKQEISIVKKPEQKISIVKKPEQKISIVKKPEQKISIVKKPKVEISNTPKNTPKLDNPKEDKYTVEYTLPTFNLQISKKEDVKKYVVSPLLKACEIFWDKNIMTTGSYVWSIQPIGKIQQVEDYISIDYGSLSEENKVIAQNIIKEGGAYEMDFPRNSIKLIISKVGELTIEEMEKKSIDIANRFVNQDLLWYQPTTLESRIKRLELDKSMYSGSQEAFDREIERTKKEWSSGTKIKGYYFDPQTQTYWGSKELYDKRPKHLY